MASDDKDQLAGSSYELLGKLGRGASGVVYAARHIALRKRVVVKILNKKSAVAMADRMRLEAQAVAALAHPNVVAALDFGRTADGRSYFVMEHLEGRSLFQEVQARGPLPISEAVGIIRQILAGLSEAHRIGIVHRDLSASNLFLCTNGVAKILDFGIAKVLLRADARKAPAPLKAPTEDGTVIGSPRYLSPEQARGAPVDARSDLYSVGVVLYLLLAGRDPFHAVPRGETYQLLRAHLSTTPEPPSTHSPNVPAELDAVVMKALAKDPAARHASADAFSEALAAALKPARVRAHRRWDRTEKLAASDRTEPLSLDRIAEILAAAKEPPVEDTTTVRLPEPAARDLSPWEARPVEPKETGTLVQLRVHYRVFAVLASVVLIALAALLYWGGRY